MSDWLTERKRGEKKESNKVSLFVTKTFFFLLHTHILNSWLRFNHQIINHKNIQKINLILNWMEIKQQQKQN
jgi:hypothetical protein